MSGKEPESVNKKEEAKDLNVPSEPGAIDQEDQNKATLEQERDEKEDEISGAKVCEILREAAKEANESKDYISYATILDVYLSKPYVYTFEDRDLILTELLDIFRSNEEMVYEIGWDIPALLLDYFRTDYDLNRGLMRSTGVKTLMNIFSTLARLGNAKEVYLKAVEALTRLRMDCRFSADYDIDEENDEKYKDNVVPKGCTRDPESYNERTFDVQFYALFELMSYTLRRINVQYPSRFLATTTGALLSFLTLNIDEISVHALGVLIRRLFTFARDYTMNPLLDDSEHKEQLIVVSEDERQLQRYLLQSYVSWVVDSCLQQTSASWSKRLFYELKKNLAQETKRSLREQVWSINLNFAGIFECVERLSQLAYSFDIDLDKLFVELIERDENKKSQPQADSETADNNNLVNNEEEENLFRGLSDDGIILMYTQIKFSDRQAKVELTLPQLIKLANKFLRRGSEEEDDSHMASTGIQDAICFWSLWVTRNITEDQVQEIGQTEFVNYLQSMMLISASSADQEIRFLTYSIIAKLLSLHREQVSFEFIIDTLKYCPFDNVRDATVRILKDFALRRRVQESGLEDMSRHMAELGVKDDKKAAAADAAADLPNSGVEKKASLIITLANDRIRRIQEVITTTIDDIVSDEEPVSPEAFGVLLQWLNFVTVIETDKIFLKDLVDKVSVLIKSDGDGDGDVSDDDDDDNKRRKKLLGLSVESITKRWFR